jgi:hypothetical protein
MKELTRETINNIVENADTMFDALLNLYKEAIAPIEWDDIETLNPAGVQTNRFTSEFILEEMHKKFTGEEGDPWPVNSLILNKGFSLPTMKFQTGKLIYRMIATP